ncbi:MAG: type III pantothenate kinase [Planctomycetota bacterium]
MLLATVDIGNTRTRIGFFRGRRLEKAVSLPARAADRVNRAIKRADVVAVASVCPPAEKKLKHPARRCMGRHFPPAVKIDVDRPKEVGMDRLANAAAAYARAQGPCVVVDLGTATTFDVVDRRGAFIGGLIAPGIAMGAEALAARTALLPRVRPGRPGRLIGRGTVEAIRSGLHWSAAGLIEVVLRELRRKMGRRTVVFGTGGEAPLFRRHFDRVVPDLTLEGIRISYVRHCMPDDRARPRRRRGR